VAAEGLQLGLMALLMLAGLVYWLRWTGRHAIPPRVFAWLVLLGTALGLAGGHLAYVFQVRMPTAQLGEFLLTLNGWRSGFSSVGVLLGFGLAVCFVGVRSRFGVLVLADLVAVGIFGFSTIWRVGCFFDGCCYGNPTTLPWGIHPAGSTGLVHPTQLYEAGTSAVLFLLAPLTMRMLNSRMGDGKLLLACLLSYACERLVIDHFRVGASLDPVALGMSLTQLIALAAIATLGPLLFTLTLRSKQATLRQLETARSTPR